jgi:hypothetical protein
MGGRHDRLGATGAGTGGGGAAAGAVAGVFEDVGK